jgi:hypothetical protein
MKKKLKNAFRHYLLNKGIMLQRATEKDKVLKLIEGLYPIRSELELIRLGPNGDGGYLLPNDLEGIEACFSPGVAQVSEFELDCLKYEMKVFMADKSVEKPNLNISEDEYDFLFFYMKPFSKIYQGKISGFKGNSNINLKIRALDKLGNQTKKEIQFATQN